jgi:hypothetical protein
MYATRFFAHSVQRYSSYLNSGHAARQPYATRFFAHSVQQYGSYLNSGNAARQPYATRFFAHSVQRYSSFPFGTATERSGCSVFAPGTNLP